MRSVHDQVLHEDAVDTGVLLHRARQAIAIMQRVEQVVAVTAMMACPSPCTQLK